uniref:dihydrofolate reductase n=1 Tax=Candidatus Electronema sp. TaxID=2698783 RepID=UPI004056BE5B
MELILIAAVAANGVIGWDNAIPWQIPGEQARFREITWGHCLIMGRRTWQSLGRPLPGRRNIVVTRDLAFAAPGAEIVHSLDEAVTVAGPDATKIFVIGGEQLYSAALDRAADVLILSRIDQAFAGDAFFPPFSSPPYMLTQSERIDGSLPYTVETWRRLKT